MYILQLNDMRSSNIEIMRTVARADTQEELEEFLAREKVETYEDGPWRKSYRQGGPLEWFNPPWSIFESFIDIGTLEQALETTRQNWQGMLDEVPTIPVDVDTITEVAVACGIPREIAEYGKED